MSRSLVLGLSLAVSSMAQTTAKEAQDLAAYPLTMDHVTRQYQALMDLTRQEQQDDGLKREVQGWSGLPLEQQIQRYGTNPKVAAIVNAHGISAHDQVMTQTALMALMIALPSIEQKKGPNAKNKLQFDASPADHVKFYREHQAEISKLGAELVDVALGKK
jgi:ABC-type glycerol-3-phosphate transport system substrate-binding protein